MSALLTGLPADADPVADPFDMDVPDFDTPKRGPGRPRKAPAPGAGGSTSAGAPSAEGKPAARPVGRWAAAEETRRNLYLLVEGASYVVGLADAFDGEVIERGGPAIVDALIDLARTDKRLRRYLELTAAPGKYGPLTMAVMGVALPIVIHHGLAPKIPALFRTNLSTPTGSEV